VGGLWNCIANVGKWRDMIGIKKWKEGAIALPDLAEHFVRFVLPVAAFPCPQTNIRTRSIFSTQISCKLLELKVPPLTGRKLTPTGQLAEKKRM